MSQIFLFCRAGFETEAGRELTDAAAAEGVYGYFQPESGSGWVLFILADGTDAITFEKGDEMGRFKLGSTVVSTFAPNMIEFNVDARAGTVTRLGEHYANIVNAD